MIEHCAKRIGLTAVQIGLVMVTSSRVQAGDESEFKHPVMRVPKLSAAPTIDGKIDPAEWRRAAAFTGVTSEGSVGGHGSLVPEIQQAE